MCGLMLLLSSTSHATVLTWVGAVSTDALNPLNWNPAQAPSAADSLVVQLGNLVLNDDLTVQGLALSTGTTLSGAGNITVTTIFTMRDSTLSGTGILTLGAQATGSLESLEITPFTKNTIERPVYNNGVLNWNSGKITLNEDFYNQSSGIFNINTDATMQSSLPQAQKATFNNAGQFIKAGSVNQTTLAVYMNNSGIVQVLQGRLNLGPRYIQTGGQTKLDGGSINGSGGASQQYLGGTLEGSGSVSANVMNDGASVSPGHSPGSITINGNYTQTSNGTLNMEIAGLNAGSQYDQLIVNGTATLDGTLKLTMLNDFLPKDGDNFQLLTYYSVVGSWASYDGFSLTPSLTITKTITPTYFVATAKVVDNAPPTINITSPTSGLCAKANPVVSGTAADDTGGSGLALTTIFLYRYATGTSTVGCWNGAAWEATYNAVTHEKATSGTSANWTYSLPTLADGQYYVRATAKDNSGNVNVSPNTVFTIDKTAPNTLTVTSPATWVKSLTAILGTATDNAEGSGIDRVEVSIQRSADNNYWTGSGWASNSQFTKAATDSATLNGWAWYHSDATPLPAGANLQDGAYSLMTSAYDKANNVKTLTSTFNVDTIAPTVEVTSPVNNTIHTSQPMAQGTANDGGALESVKVRLYRYATATQEAGYWAGGTTWSATYSEANDILATGTGNWSLRLPALNIGNYFVEAVARDKAGNQTISPQIAFIKLPDVPTTNPPSVTIDDVTLTEGDSGSTNATFTVTLSKISLETISVNAIPYNGSARAPFDYTSGGERLIFQAGETVKTFSVPVKGDLLNETNETFFVILSSPVNASISRGRGVGIITDNDAPPTITIDDVRIGEGNAGQRTAAFRLKLSAPSGQVVRVNFATEGSSATSSDDFVVVANEIAFTTGNVYAYARVLINGDELNEPDETFFVNLSSPTNATISDNQALGLILNDDSAPALTINDASLTEGDEGIKNLTFTVTLSKASGQTVTVKYATADGIARSSSDYTAKSGTLSFAAGQISKTISVVINGDTQVEGDETLFILLTGATNASVGRARGTGTILNDDTSE